jgi:glycosyltransferase involved in cell wall biosynthesis
MRQILFVSPYGTMGGAERAVVELVSGLDPRRFEAAAVVGGAGGYTDALRSRGVEVATERIPVMPLHGLARPRTLVRSITASRRLVRRVKTKRIAIVHFTDLIPALLTAPARRYGARVVYQVAFLGGVARRFLLRALGHALADHIVAYSHDQARAIATAVPSLASRLSVVYPGIDPAEWSAGDGAAFRREIGVPPGTPLVGLIGRYDTWKGHGVFVEAAARLREALPQARFAIVGGALNQDALPHVARYRREVLDQLRGLGLAEVVSVLGHRDDVASVLAGLDVLAFPSAHEPFGMVVLEALAAGTPVVASDTGGPAEILENERSGLLFPTGNADALAAATLRLLRTPVLREALMEGGRQRLDANFTRGRYAKDMEAVYDRLAA